MQKRSIVYPIEAPTLWMKRYGYTLGKDKKKCPLCDKNIEWTPVATHKTRGIISIPHPCNSQKEKTIEVIFFSKENKKIHQYFCNDLSSVVRLLLI